MLSLQKGEQWVQRVEAECLISATEQDGSRLSPLDKYIGPILR
jgi:hypothetical protein